jgi:surface protein
MFYGADAFNQDITHWDVSQVTNMQKMFRGARNFDQNIGSWDVSSVTDMQSMFQAASHFNGDVENWKNGAKTQNVTNMNSMFKDAGSFSSHDLSGWDVANVTKHDDFCNGNWLTRGNKLPDSSLSCN